MKRMTFNGAASALNEKEMQNVVAGSGVSGRSCMLMGAGVMTSIGLGILHPGFFVAAMGGFFYSVGMGCFD